METDPFHKMPCLFISDFRQEPYNPEAPGIVRPNMPPYWPGGPEGMPPFLRGPPPPLPTRTIEQQRLPVHARLGNRDLINLTVKKDVQGKNAIQVLLFLVILFFQIVVVKSSFDMD